MVGFSRATMPEEFYDKTSDMLLVQPEPEYFYCRLSLGALAISLTPEAELGVAPNRSVGGVGANYTPAEADQLRLSNPMFTEAIAAKFDFTAGPGSTIRVNRPQYLNSTYTQASRLVSVGTSISTVAIAPTSEQNNITLYRFAGPYDQANGRVAPYAIEAFDANMGVHKASQIVGNQLKRDFWRFNDAVIVALLDLAANAFYPDGMSAPNDATTTGSFPFTYELLTRLEAAADQASMPQFSDGFRAFVGTPLQLKQLKDDPQYQRASQFFPEYSILFPGYVATVNKTHIFRSSTLSIINNSSSVPIHYGHFFGPGPLMVGMGRPPRVQASNDDNYGETAKVIWRADLAFALANNQLVYSVRSSA